MLHTEPLLGRATHALPSPTWRRLAAHLLLAAGRALQRGSRHLYHPGRVAPPARVQGELPRIEYCGEAGAPEGALYIDGRYVGQLPVDRL